MNRLLRHFSATFLPCGALQHAVAGDRTHSRLLIANLQNLRYPSGLVERFQGYRSYGTCITCNTHPKFPVVSSWLKGLKALPMAARPMRHAPFR
jgi:hypothetical protein